MLKLYAHPNHTSPNSLKLRVALTEVGAPFEYVPVDLTKGEQRRPEFLAINAHGKIPVLVDGDFVLPESDAILWYIAESFPAAKLLGSTPRDHARTLEWCDFNSTALYPAYFELWQHGKNLAPEKRIASLAESAQQRIKRSLDVLEGALGKREYLAGAFSIADIALAGVARMIFEDRLKDFFGLADYPHIQAWYRRVTARPAWQKAIA
jgi:glutathione S-transferase